MTNLGRGGPKMVTKEIVKCKQGTALATRALLSLEPFFRPMAEYGWQGNPDPKIWIRRRIPQGQSTKVQLQDMMRVQRNCINYYSIHKIIFELNGTMMVMMTIE